MKIRILFLIGILFLSTNITFADIKGKNNNTCSRSVINTHPENWKNSEISSLLKKGKVISIRPMKEYLQSCGKKAEFDGEVYFVELDNGLKAVFKSLPKDDLGDAYAEVAAYQASIILGFPHVPPTVMTTIKGMKGSLQLFVETDIDALDPGIYDSALKETPLEDVANLHLFYFVFGQWDSGPHNILILKDKEKTHLIAIDNSGIRNHQHVKYGSLPFVRVLYSDKLQTNDWDKPFPFEQVKTIENPTTEKMRQIFANTLPESYYQSFKSYGLPLRYVTYRNSLWKQYHAGHESFVMSFTNCQAPESRSIFSFVVGGHELTNAPSNSAVVSELISFLFQHYKRSGRTIS
jgi:hypothetical protein